MTANTLRVESRGRRRPPVPAAAAWLGGTGLIPFIALAAAAVVSPAEARGAYVDWLIRYGAVIVTFVGALHWGALMRSPGAPSAEQWLHLSWSVVPALGAWVALGLAPPAALAALIALLVAQLIMDRRLALVQDLLPWFLPLRFRLTLVALGCLALTLAAGLPAAAD